MLVELVTKGVFKLLWIFVFGRLKLKIAQLKKNFFNGSDFVASHMFFKCNRLRLRAESFREEKDLRRKLFDGVIFLLYFCWQEIKF